MRWHGKRGAPCSEAGAPLRPSVSDAQESAGDD
jgi:hypothetical protein